MKLIWVKYKYLALQGIWVKPIFVAIKNKLFAICVTNPQNVRLIDKRNNKK